VKSLKMPIPVSLMKPEVEEEEKKSFLKKFLKFF